MNLLYELFAESAAVHGSRPALVCGSETVTYAGLLRMVDVKADLLPPKLRAATMPVRTNMEGVVALLACAKNGVCVLPLPFDTTREEQERLTHELFRERPDELPFLLLQTSGTTGDPKLIMLSQETKVLRARQFAELYGVRRDDVVLVGTPLHYSMPQRLVFTSLLCGATAQLLPQYSPELWLAEAERCSVVVGVPQQMQFIDARELPRLRVALSTSAQRADVLKLNPRYCDCYGTSEIAIATYHYPVMPPVANVGYAAPGVLIRLSNEGEIEVKTPLVFDGYYKRADLTAAAMTDDGYFRTGDAGRLDTHRWLHITGRLDDVIKVGSTKVYPEAVEAAVCKIPGVVECAAVGVPDEKLGEHVHVVVVMGGKTAQPTLRQVQHACAGELRPAAMPRSLSFVDALPRTANGKLQRRLLK